MISRQPDKDESTTDRWLRFMSHKRDMQAGVSTRSGHSCWSFETFCNARAQGYGGLVTTVSIVLLSLPSYPFSMKEV